MVIVLTFAELVDTFPCKGRMIRFTFHCRILYLTHNYLVIFRLMKKNHPSILTLIHLKLKLLTILMT